MTRPGVFQQRPHYELNELDRECEDRRRLSYGGDAGRSSPITTDELSVLIEQDGYSLDSYADLSRLVMTWRG